MKRTSVRLFTVLVITGMLLAACAPKATSTPTTVPVQKTAVEPTQSAAQTAASTDQPNKISGEFTYSNDFVVKTYYVEHAVALADMHGFIARDKEWLVPTESQTLGFASIDLPNMKGSFWVQLPEVPEGSYNDVDNNGKEDKGLQIFAVSYWPNLTGGPYSEGDDATRGWPNYLASVKTDTENNDEVTAGKLLIWAPDAKQQFPTGFGDDDLLFTKDDPAGPVPAGYSVVDLDQKPFKLSRQPEEKMTLYEPADVAIKDFSKDSYTDAFKKMFDQIKKEYAFNDIEGKAPDWDTLWAELEPRVKDAETNKDAMAFYLAVRDFTFAFKDGHVGASGGDMENQVLYDTISTGYGFAIRVLDDQSVIVTYVTQGGPAEQAKVQVGAVVTDMNGTPIMDAISKVQPLSAPFSTDFSRVYQQARYLLRAPADTQATFTITNPKGKPQKVTLKAVAERASYNISSVYLNYDSTALPVEYKILDSGVGYVRINSNDDDLNLIVRLFQRALTVFRDNQLPGIIIDMRVNPGGSPLGLAGFLTDKEIPMGQLEYFSDKTGKFEAEGPRDKFTPNVEQYKFDKMALLVGQGCASACEIEAYGFSQVPGMMVVGETPSGGIEAEVARGQFLLPDGLSLQVPTGRFIMEDGSIFLEGKGVQPTIKVPVNAENVLSGEDYVLNAAVDAVLKPDGAGVTPNGAPKVASAADSLAAIQTGSVKQLEELAGEQYDNPTKAGEAYPYTISLKENQPLVWAYGWCASGQKALDANMKHIKLKFTLDGQDVPSSQFGTAGAEPQTGLNCFTYFVELTDWPGGEHHLQTSVTFDAAINDGSATYPKGTFTYDYTVYVKP
jgi:C-terminal processing protease CtpA/Prc